MTRSGPEKLSAAQARSWRERTGSEWALLATETAHGTRLAAKEILATEAEHDITAPAKEEAPLDAEAILEAIMEPESLFRVPCVFSTSSEALQGSHESLLDVHCQGRSERLASARAESLEGHRQYHGKT